MGAFYLSICSQTSSFLCLFVGGHFLFNSGFLVASDVFLMGGSLYLSVAPLICRRFLIPGFFYLRDLSCRWPSPLVRISVLTCRPLLVSGCSLFVQSSCYLLSLPADILSSARCFNLLAKVSLRISISEFVASIYCQALSL